MVKLINFYTCFIIFLVQLIMVQFVLCVPAQTRFPDDFRISNFKILNLEPSAAPIGPSKLKKTATMGILVGAIQAEEKMEKNLMDMLLDLFKSVKLPKVSNKQTMQKMQAIESVMDRDKKAVRILNVAMTLAMASTSLMEYQNTLKSIAMEDVTSKKLKLAETKKSSSAPSNKQTMQKMDSLKKDVVDHIRFMRSTLTKSAEDTLKYLGATKKIKSTSSPIQYQPLYQNEAMYFSAYDSLPMLISHLPYYQDQENFDSFEWMNRFRRQDDSLKKIFLDGQNTKQNENQITVDITTDRNELDSGEIDKQDAPGGGGIAGLIASLSGVNLGRRNLC